MLDGGFPGLVFWLLKSIVPLSRKSCMPEALLGTPFEKGIPAAEASPGLNFSPGSARTRPRREAGKEKDFLSFATG